MKSCPNCGTQNADEASFCSNCGQSLAAAAQQQGVTPQQGPPTTQMSPPSTSSTQRQESSAFAPPQGGTLAPPQAPPAGPGGGFVPPPPSGGSGKMIAIVIGVVAVLVVGALLFFFLRPQPPERPPGDGPPERPEQPPRPEGGSPDEIFPQQVGPFQRQQVVEDPETAAIGASKGFLAKYLGPAEILYSQYAFPSADSARQGQQRLVQARTQRGFQVAEEEGGVIILAKGQAGDVLVVNGEILAEVIGPQSALKQFLDALGQAGGGGQQGQPGGGEPKGKEEPKKK